MKTAKKSRKSPLRVPSLSAAALGVAVGGSLPKESGKKLPDEQRSKLTVAALPTEQGHKLAKEEGLK